MVNIRKHLNSLLEEMREQDIEFDDRILSAFESVERHRFTPVLWTMDEESSELVKNKIDPEDPPGELIGEIYQDSPLVIESDGEDVISTSSQPTVMAFMIDAVSLKEGMKVLEVGSGSGYNAAILSEITGSDENVFTLEIREETASRAQNNLRGNGYSGVTLLEEDGGFGYKDGSPYDAVIVTCSSSTITKNWIEQLKVGGKLCAPLATRGMETLVDLEKVSDTKLRGQATLYVRFLRFTGLSTSLSHKYILSSERSSLTKLIEKHSEIDEELTDKICSEERKERMDFEFFMAITSPQAICYYRTENGENIRAYGIWDRDWQEGGFALISEGEVISYGNPEVRERLDETYNSWKSLGKPALEDYSMKFHLSDDPESFEKSTGDHWVIEREGVVQTVEL